MPALEQRPAAEIDESFLASHQMVQADYKQAVGKHLAGSEAALGAIERILPGVRAKQQLIAVHTTFAVEDGLSGDEGIHDRLSAAIP